MKKFIKILLIILLIVPIMIFASGTTSEKMVTYSKAIEKANNYNKAYNDRAKFLVLDIAKYDLNQNGLNVIHEFATGGLISKDEYQLSLKRDNTYLIAGKEYWTLTPKSPDQYYVDYELLSKPQTQKSGVRVTQFVKSEITVSGDGSFSNPWVFEEIYKIKLDSGLASIEGFKYLYEKYGVGFSYSLSNSTFNLSVSSARFVAPRREGYVFNGYYSQKNGGGDLIIDPSGKVKVSSTYFTSDSTIYASWTPIEYGVYANCKNNEIGEYSLEAEIRRYDEVFTINNCTKNVRANLVIDGSEGITVNYTNSDFTSTNTVTKPYSFEGWDITGMDNSLHYIDNEENASEELFGVKATSFLNLRSTEGIVEFGGTWKGPDIKLPTITKTGYNCYWASDEYEYPSGGVYTPVSENGATERTFTATCEQQTTGIYKIKLDKQGGRGGTNYIYEKYNEGWYSNSLATTELVYVNKPTKEGYELEGFYSLTGGSGDKILGLNASNKLVVLVEPNTFTADGVIFANWNPIRYNLVFNTGDASCSTCFGGLNTCPIRADYDQEFTVTGARKSYSVTLNLGTSNPTISYTGSSFSRLSLTKNYTFNGWNISGMDTSTHLIGVLETNDEILYNVTSTTFKNLRSTAGTVTFEAQYSPLSITLPSITKEGYECVWESDNENYQSGSSFFAEGCSKSFTAVCTEIVSSPVTYEFTLNKKGGTGGPTKIYERNSEGWFETEESTNVLQQITTPTKLGYKYDGYYTTNSTSGKKVVNQSGIVDQSTANGFTSNGTLYAQYTPNSYTVTKDCSTSVCNLQTINYDQEFTYDYSSGGIAYNITVSLGNSGATVDYSGSDFTSSLTSVTKNASATGWNITGMDSTTHYFGSSSSTSTSATNVTATTFKNLRSTSGTVRFETVRLSPSFKLPKITKSNYECYWAGGDDDELSYASGATVSSSDLNATSIALTAKCTQTHNIYTITLNKQGGTGGTSTIYEKYGIGWYSNSGATTQITSITKPTKEGYYFSGYQKNSSCSASYIIPSTGSLSNVSPTVFSSNGNLYACFSPRPYYIETPYDEFTAYYDSLITIPNPTKTITASISYSTSGGLSVDRVGSSFEMSKIVTLNYGFKGWDISGMDGCTHYIGSTSNTSTSTTATGIMGTKFKNLRSSSGIVAFEDKYNSLTITLPTVTKPGNICSWVSNNNHTFESGGTVTVSGQSTISFTPSCSPSQLNVTLDFNGGSSTSTGWTKWDKLTGAHFASKQILYTDTYPTFPTVTRTGYTFSSWSNRYNFGNYTLVANTGNSTAKTVYSGVVPGVTYKVMIGSAEKTVSGTSGTKFTVAIYDYTTSSYLDSQDVSFGSNISVSLTCPTTAIKTNKLTILLFAGKKGSTAGNTVEFTNVKIQTANPTNEAIFNNLYTPSGTNNTTAHELVAKWTAKTYSLSYDLDAGSYGESHPTSANYDSSFTINKATKSITVILNNEADAILSFANTSDFSSSSLSKTKNYSFAGWDISNMDSVTHNVGSSSTTTSSTTATGITGTYYKNLRSTSGTVAFVAKWSVPSFKLPKVSKTGYSCNWQTSSGSYTYNSEGTYSPSAVGGATSRTLYARCTSNSYTCAEGKYLPKSSSSCSDCLSGYYCPGGTWSYSSSSNQGLKSCSTNTTYYPNSASKSTSISKCYMSVPAGYKVATAKADKVACSSNYTSSEHTVYYGDTSSCTGKKYKITLSKGSGSGGDSYVYVKYNKAWYRDSNLTLLMSTSGNNAITKPTWSGHTFKGYYTSSGGGTQYISSSGKITSTATSDAGLIHFTSAGTLYAHWSSSGGSSCNYCDHIHIRSNSTNQVIYERWSPKSTCSSHVYVCWPVNSTPPHVTEDGCEDPVGGNGSHSLYCTQPCGACIDNSDCPTSNGWSCSATCSASEGTYKCCTKGSQHMTCN